jgi:hypothetical protein
VPVSVSDTWTVAAPVPVPVSLPGTWTVALSAPLPVSCDGTSAGAWDGQDCCPNACGDMKPGGVRIAAGGAAGGGAPPPEAFSVTMTAAIAEVLPWVPE